MSRELKVYNEFGEVILNLRASSGVSPTLLTVDATKEMEKVVNELKGRDLDITIHKGAEEIKFTAKWGSPEFLRVLARYLVDNFGWKTKLTETSLPALANTTSASGSLVSYSRLPGENSAPNSALEPYRIFGSLSVDDPTQKPQLSFTVPATGTGLVVDRH